MLLAEIATALVSRWFGYRLGLKAFRVEVQMLAILVALSGSCLLIMKSTSAIAGLHPLVQLLGAGAVVTAILAPLLLRQLLPLIRGVRR